MRELAGRLAAKPEIAVHMTKTQLRAYAQRASLGDVRETDGDVLLAASQVGVAREAFRRPGARGGARLHQRRAAGAQHGA